jgi:hypothetical protein
VRSDSICWRWVRGVVVEWRIWRARDGRREVHLSLVVDEESIARRRVRTWEVGSSKGSERRSGVREYVSGVEAVDEGDDRGLDEADVPT